MRIIDTYEITFKGTYQGDLESPRVKSFWIQDDDNSKFQITIPDQGKLVEAFHWLSENDCLRHLKEIVPVFTTNADEIEQVKRKNATIEEHSYLQGTTLNRINPKTFEMEVFIAGLHDIPDLIWEATWTFWSREHAVMFKLAMGGES